MSDQDPGPMGRLSDEEEAQEPSSSTDGPGTGGEEDAREGSPGVPHPTGEDFPHEAVRYDDPERRRDPDADS